MITDQIISKMELKHFLVFVIPSMIFSFTVLYTIHKLLGLNLLGNFTNLSSQFVILLTFYLLASGLLFGVVFYILYLLFFPRPPIENTDDDVFQKCPGEFRTILLKTVNIDIEYKQIYRAFFGNLCISTLLSSILLFVLLPLSSAIKFVLILLIIMFIFSYYAAGKLTKEVTNTEKDLIKKLKPFLNCVKKNFPEEVYKNILIKK